MRLIHTAGFNAFEREQFRSIVFSNMLLSMRTMLEAMEIMAIPFSNEANDDYIDLILDERELQQGEALPLEYREPFRSLWADSGVQLAAQKGNEYALHDNVFYFFASLDRLFAPKYVPDDQDILHSRLRTTGISETVFHLNDLTYRMFDVGGQRSERKKWIHCFENVTALLFLVAISGYDQCLIEDKDANQISEALMLFDSICNSQWFLDTSMILFLNKIDLFKIKIKHSPIRNHFPEFALGLEEQQAKSEMTCMLFFQEKFVKLNRNSSKDIYSHFTNATDTKLLRSVMLSVTDIILQKNLQILVL